MKKLAREVRKLRAEIRDIQAYLGVLSHVFEREYRKGRWNWEQKTVRPRARRAK